MPDGKLHVVFCNVGQGDGAVITLGYFQAVIDTGAYEDKILKCLDQHIPFWDKELELVIISHADKDHVGALPGINKFYRIGRLVEKAKVGDMFRYTSLYFDVIKGSEDKATSSDGSQTNLSSIVVEVRYGEFSALFTGDIDIASEKVLAESGYLRKVDVLKVAHHGSKNSSSVEFLDRVRPDYAVISSGKNNSYGHPTKEALERLGGVGAKVMRTDSLGTVELLSDGQDYKLTKQEYK